MVLVPTLLDASLLAFRLRIFGSTERFGVISGTLPTLGIDVDDE